MRMLRDYLCEHNDIVFGTWCVTADVVHMYTQCHFRARVVSQATFKVAGIGSSGCFHWGQPALSLKKHQTVDNI